MSKQIKIEELKRVLKQVVGNKRYLGDIDTLLDKLPDLSPNEKQAIQYLMQDLEQLSRDSKKK